MKTFLLESDPYIAKDLDGPPIEDLKGVAAETKIRTRVEADRTVGLRIISEDNYREPMGSWIVNYIDFWLSLFPDTPRVLVRTIGWPKLWDAGYPKRVRAIFDAIDHERLCQTIGTQPDAAVWWVEVMDHPQQLGGDTMMRYAAFSYYGWGWAPIFVGSREYIDHVIARYVEHFPFSNTETRQAGSQGLENVVKELDYNNWAAWKKAT